jgi:hypothetical protein
MTVHLVLYSNGEPFETTKQMTIESIHHHTTNKVVIHDYNLERIKGCSWFSQIQDLSTIEKVGRRDGYYCAYKPFCSWEVYQTMSEGDILYYVDSSQHFKVGFTQSIDKLCDIVLEKGFIAGSVGDNIQNNSRQCCDIIGVWNKIIPNNDNTKYLNDRHILASWFILTKNSRNTDFMNEWIKWCVYKDSDLPLPLITYHHPGDQSIFNILVRKYNFPVFYNKGIRHDDNKNKNRVLEVLNTSENVDQWFIYL